MHGRMLQCSMEGAMWCSDEFCFRRSAMTDLALSATGSHGWHRAVDAVRELVLAMAEGLAAARRYERLSNLSDAQLQRLGLTREDVGWFAMYGKPRPR
jgi:hypothetical protein